MRRLNWQVYFALFLVLLSGVLFDPGASVVVVEN